MSEQSSFKVCNTRIYIIFSFLKVEFISYHFVSHIEMTKYWEAYTIFRGLNLTQLDIKGNPIRDENLKLFFGKILPRFKWFDGEILPFHLDAWFSVMIFQHLSSNR